MQSSRTESADPNRWPPAPDDCFVNTPYELYLELVMTLQNRFPLFFHQLRRFSDVVKELKDIPGRKHWPIVGNSLLFTPLGNNEFVTYFSNQIQYTNIYQIILNHFW